MILTFIPLLLTGTALIFLRRFLLSRCKSNSNVPQPESVNAFDVLAYYEKMERTAIEIWEDKQQREQYALTLWAGVNGLQMNPDGTFEWIQRKKNIVDKDSPKPSHSGNLRSEIGLETYDICNLYTRSRYSEMQMAHMNTVQMIQNSLAASQYASQIHAYCNTANAGGQGSQGCTFYANNIAYLNLEREYLNSALNGLYVRSDENVSIYGHGYNQNGRSYP